MKFILFQLFFVIFTHCFGQIGIGTTNPHSSALLEIKSNTKGFLVPRVVDDSYINNPTEGLIIYDYSDHCMNVYRGQNWINLCSGTNETCEKNFYNTSLSGDIKQMPFFINLDGHRGLHLSAITSDGELFVKGKFNTILKNSIVGEDTLALVKGPWTDLGVKLIESCFLYDDETTMTYTVGVISDKLVFVANNVDTVNTGLNQFRVYTTNQPLLSNEFFTDIKCTIRGVLVLTNLGNLFYLASKNDHSYDASLTFNKLISITEPITRIEDTKGSLNTHFAAYGENTGSLYVIGETDGTYEYNITQPVTITIYPESSFGNDSIIYFNGLTRIVVLTESGNFYRINGNTDDAPTLNNGIILPPGETIKTFINAHITDLNVVTESNKLYYISTNPPVLINNFFFSTESLSNTTFERMKTSRIFWIANGQIFTKQAQSNADLPSLFIPILE